MDEITINITETVEEVAVAISDGEGGGSTITYVDGVASCTASGTTIHWLASETNPDA